MQSDPLGDADGGGVGVFVGRGVNGEGEEGADGEGEGAGFGWVEAAGAGGDLLADCETLHYYCSLRFVWLVSELNEVLGESTK